MLEREGQHPAMHLNAFRVIYDMQNDKYLKVHKHLGTETLVYKDGSDIKKFQPGLTGQLNSSRRFHNQQTTLGSQASEALANHSIIGLKQHESHFIVRRKMQHNHEKTLDRKARQRDLATIEHNHKPHSLQTRSSDKDMKKMLPAITQKDFFKKIIANRERELHQQQTLPVDELSNTLKRFNELRQDSIYENHSIKKSIPGSSPKYSPDRIHLANKQYFDTLATETSASIHFSTNKGKHNSSLSRLNHLPERMKPNSQYLREREFFFKVHPDSKTKQKEPDIVRRDNLKRLERQFLEQSSRNTNRIYDHE